MNPVHIKLAREILETTHHQRYWILLIHSNWGEVRSRFIVVPGERGRARGPRAWPRLGRGLAENLKEMHRLELCRRRLCTKWDMQERPTSAGWGEGESLKEVGSLGL